MKTDNNESSIVSFPCKSDKNVSVLELSKEIHLPASVKTSPISVMRIPNCKFTAYIDDNIIYEQNNELHTIGIPYSFICFQLPDNWNGKVLKFKFTRTKYTSSSFYINAPMFSVGTDILYYLSYVEFTQLIAVIVLFLFGFLSLLMFVLSTKISKKTLFSDNFAPSSMLWMSIFSILSSCLLLSQTAPAKAFIQNETFLFYAKYLIIMILPAPLLARYSRMLKYRPLGKALNAISVFLVINSFLFLILIPLKIISISLIVTYAHILLAFSFLLFFICLFFISHEKSYIFSYISINLLLIGCVIDLLSWYSFLQFQPLFGSKLGLLFFVTVECLAFLFDFYRIYYNFIKNSVYIEMAKTDVMTGLGNRLAFEEELKSLKSSQYTAISCFSLDIDNLKITNDTKGHGAGDLLIKKMSHCLREAFKDEKRIYRIGGDEFVVLSDNKNDYNTATQALSKFSKILEPEIPLVFSVGYSLCKNPLEIDECIHYSDMDLYENKRQRKTNEMLNNDK